MKLLIVEDAKDQRMILAAILRKKGHTVLEAENGIDAFEILKKTKDIRLVISDWMMPKMSGPQLCKAIRNYSFDYYLYFILLTGKSERKSLVKGMNEGADDFISKPVNFDELNARLNAGIRIIELETMLAEKNKNLKKALSIIESDMASAEKTQAELLSQPAIIQNISFDWFFQPCKHLGGDMFGYHPLDDDHLCFYQLDVAGHGIPAALFSFTLNHILSDSSANSICKTSCSTNQKKIIPQKPEQVLYLLNNKFQTSADNMLYFTIAYGVINSRTGEVLLAQAGHPSPLWIDKQSNKINPISGKGIPIGMMSNAKYRTQKIQLNPGDRLFLYSDGITECENKYNEQFGERRLIQPLNKLSDVTIKDTINILNKNIMSWNQGVIANDDINYLILEWNPK